MLRPPGGSRKSDVQILRHEMLSDLDHLLRLRLFHRAVGLHVHAQTLLVEIGIGILVRPEIQILYRLGRIRGIHDRLIVNLGFSLILDLFLRNNFMDSLLSV